jgi:RNA polymerase sigma factor (sigma-70 family)
MPSIKGASMTTDHHTHDTTTAELVARFTAGDDRALATLMRRFNTMMRRAACRYLRSDDDVADAVQEAWASFTHHADAIREPERLAAWLRVTASRAALTIAVRQSRVQPVADVDDLRRGGVSDEIDNDELGSRRQAVRDALHRLNARERQLVQLLVAEPKPSYEEIAVILGCSIGSIGPTRQRICSKLSRDPAIRRVALGGAA